MPFLRVLEMSLTREEFLRVFPTVVEAFVVDGDHIRWIEADADASMRLAVLAPRQLGSLAVPRLRVELDLAVPTPVGEAFVARFRRACLRAGG